MCSIPECSRSVPGVKVTAGYENLAMSCLGGVVCIPQPSAGRNLEILSVELAETGRNWFFCYSEIFAFSKKTKGTCFSWGRDEDLYISLESKTSSCTSKPNRPGNFQPGGREDRSHYAPQLFLFGSLSQALPWQELVTHKRVPVEKSLIRKVSSNPRFVAHIGSNGQNTPWLWELKWILFSPLHGANATRWPEGGNRRCATLGFYALNNH